MLAVTRKKRGTISEKEPFALLLQRRHLFLGWLGLLVFLSLGIVLETLHGFKVGLYVDADHSVRRLMWTLCHVHGTLFSLIHIAFACSLGMLGPVAGERFRFASWCLTGAIVFMPLGFFLGGVQTMGGDPGLGILLVPLGALLLFCAVTTIVVTLRKSNEGPGGLP